MDPAAQGVTGGFTQEPCALSLDTDPADRHFDRLLACMGALDDALPLFQSGRRIPHAGVLLAVPALIQSGFLIARLLLLPEPVVPVRRECAPAAAWW